MKQSSLEGDKMSQVFDLNKYLKENYDSINKMLKSSIKKRELSKKNMILGHEVDVIKLSTQREPELFNNKFYVKDLNKLEKYKRKTKLGSI